MSRSKPLPPLRATAEAELARLAPDVPPARSADELLHELQVHQIELEMQNEALRQSQAALEAAHDRYLDLYEFAPVAYLTLTPSGRIAEANLTAATMFGVDREDLRETRFDRWVHAAGRAQWERAFVAAKANGVRTSCDVALERRDGSLLEVHGDCLRESAAGGSESVRVTLADISERRQAEDRLRESESFNRAVLNSLTAHIAVVDADGEIVAVNAAWERFAEANAAPGMIVRSIGQSYRDICLGALRYPNADGAAAAWAGIEDVLAGRRSSFSIEYPCDSPTEKRWFRMNVHPPQCLRDVAVVAHEDITASKVNEARLVALSRRLTLADEQARRRLSAELHDRTSPNLTALRINLEVVSAALDASSRPDLIDPIEDARALIDDTTSSLREIGSELRPPLLDYAGIHAALEGYVEQFARRTGVVVGLVCDNPGIRLESERETMLFRIAQEALTNCAKHARATSVKIGLALGRGPVVLSVVDDGLGFEPEAVGSPGAGCGMGLLNMRSMAEVAGGRFAIASRPGGGTRIRVEV